MKLLLVADQENRKIWDFYEPHLLDAYDLILSAGDLSPKYLSFLVTMSHADLLYVQGNHDRVYKFQPPEGCISVDDGIYDFYGLRILGLGGSMRYNEGECMYTEQEMQKRIRKLKGKIRRAGGFDILLAHAPIRGVNDGEDMPHWGFECFRDLIDAYHPKYFIHGHVHRSYSAGFKRVDEYHGTKVINACDKYELEIPDDDYPLWRDRLDPATRIRKELFTKHLKKQED